MSSTPPARHFEPEITEARISRQWAAIDRILDRPGRPSWRWPAAAFAVAAIAAVAVLLLRERSDNRIIGGAVFESVAGQTITLADGSRMQLAPKARMRVGSLAPKGVDLTLERGSAVFDVKHDPGRRFVVHVSEVDVVDEGTRFEVDRGDDGAVTVVVEEGSVSLHRRGLAEPPRYLSAGERWWTGRQGADGGILGGVDGGERAAPGPNTPMAAEPPANGDEPTTSAPDALPSLPRLDAKKLLELAQRAQREGDPHDAARAYDQLRRHFRADPRAGLAAFELGRLRFGALGDPRGAAQAFQDAVALSPRAPFREDAEARLVDALDSAGDLAGCQRARTAYLARYPQGLHAKGVAARCGQAP